MMRGMKLSPDDGGSGGGGDDPAGNGNNGSGGAEDKTFTQEQVNSMIAAEKRKNLSSVYKGLGFDSEEAAEEYALYLCSFAEEGTEILHLSNPGDYDYDEDNFQSPEYEIVEVDD